MSFVGAYKHIKNTAARKKSRCRLCAFVVVSILLVPALAACGRKAKLPMEYTYEIEPAQSDIETAAEPETERPADNSSEEMKAEESADDARTTDATSDEEPAADEPQEGSTDDVQPEPADNETADGEPAGTDDTADNNNEPAETPDKEDEQPKVTSKNEYTVYSGGDTGDDDLNEICDDILADIIDDDMNERERAYAIYSWVESNIRYQGSTDTSDIIAGAIRALSTYKGDCFAFCTSSMALLTRAGFDNVIAHEDDDSHFWNMVKVDGEWWHFDTTTGWGTERFLWTTDELLDYVYTNDKYGTSIWYEWDPANGPDTP